MHLYLLTYNNYYNRIVKKFDTLSEYLISPYYNNLNIDKVSFNPGDGITTEQIVDFVPVGDYLVCTYIHNGDNEETIDSRWFIIQSDRLRTGQYKLLLKRDTIVDNYESVINAPVFVEKATINDSSNPLLFNSESMTYNQIKTSETLLKDETGVQWLVAYYPLNTADTTVTISQDIGNAIDIGTTLENWKFYQYANNIEDTSHNYVEYKGPLTTNKLNIQIDVISKRSNQSTQNILSTTEDSKWYNYKPWFSPILKYTDYNKFLVMPLCDDAFNLFYNYYNNNISLFNAANEAYAGTHSGLELQQFQNLNGKTIRTIDGKYYLVSIYSDDDYLEQNIHIVNSGATAGIYGQLNNLITSCEASNIRLTGTPNDDSFVGEFGSRQYHIVLSRQESLDTSVTLSATGYKPKSSLYRIICMPYGNFTVKLNGISYNMTKDLADAFAKGLSNSLSTSLYDVQVLPYCPVRELVSIYNNIDLSDIDNKYYNIIKSDNIIKGFVFNVVKDSFSFNIDTPIYLNRTNKGYTTSTTSTKKIYVETLPAVSTPSSVNVAIDLGIPKDKYLTSYSYEYISSTAPGVVTTVTDVTINNNILSLVVNIKTTSESAFDFLIYVNLTKAYKIPTFINSYAYDLKASNEQDVYRLCSPNYNGVYEMSVAKNGGEIDYFNVDCKYKPYNPYIHVNPAFSNLYGKDFNDSRGLILGGDFSYGQITDNWTSYELSNKNYQSTFNREISNLDFNNSIIRQENAFSLATGAITSTATGAAGGALSTGSIIGGAIGGTIGATTGIVGGILDWQNQEKTIAENRDYKIDMYGYSLGNIKAQPYSLSKSNSFTTNYKEFPFIEYYTCTDIEKTALKNKLKYNGMTIMTIGTINDYLQTDKQYFQGTVIRLENLTDNTQVASDIANEIKKGIYI